MTDTRYDRAPGDRSAPPGSEQGMSSGVFIYTIGLLLAVILTGTSFWVTNTSLLWPPGVSLGLAVLAHDVPVMRPPLARLLAKINGKRTG